MRDTTAQDQAGYPGSVEWLYAWLRRHPWLVDGTLAVIVLAGAANAYLLNAAVLPASLALAGAVAVRRPLPVAAYAAGRMKVRGSPSSGGWLLAPVPSCSSDMVTLPRPAWHG